MKWDRFIPMALALGSIMSFVGMFGFLMWKGPLAASLANDDPFAARVTTPQGVNHPHVRTELAPLGLGTNVLLTYKMDTFPNQEVCLLGAWVYEGVTQIEKRMLNCTTTDASGGVSFVRTLPVGAYRKQPALITGLSLPDGAQQIDYLTLHR